MKELFDFQIGDHVQVVNSLRVDGATTSHIGHTGQVVTFLPAGRVGVSFDDQVLDLWDGGPKGHECHGYAERGRGWFCYPDELAICVPRNACPVEDLL